MAWVKLESYSAGGIIARRNADTAGWSLRVTDSGTIGFVGLRIAGNNKAISSYQSIPLGRWVHIAATIDMAVGDTTAQKIFIDGVEVPRAYTLTGTATALVQGTTDLVVGATKSAGTDPFDGKIAQAAVFSSQLDQATIRSYMSQGLTGSETNLVAAYSLDNSLLDLTANDNDLTANGGALATATDSPFGGQADGTISSTVDYGIVMKVATTTVTVQVPEGCTIPTSGGVTTLEYSVADKPFGFVSFRKRWTIEVVAGLAETTSTSWNSTGFLLSVPTGSWDVGYSAVLYTTRVSTTFAGSKVTLSTSTSAEDDLYMVSEAYVLDGAASTTHATKSNANRRKDIILESQTAYYLIYVSLGGTITTQLTTSVLTAVPGVL
jgi:hypothetical protein